MFSKVGQIMLYVNDQDESLAFGLKSQDSTLWMK